MAEEYLNQFVSLDEEDDLEAPLLDDEELEEDEKSDTDPEEELGDPIEEEA